VRLEEGNAVARKRAANYHKRRNAIVAKAARLFAERGFLGASIADLALACRTSKSLIYHYYASKEDILFDVMHSHVRALLDAAEAVMAEPVDPHEKLRRLTREFVQLYVGASARQKVLLNELGRLPKSQRALIVGIQRRLVATIESVLNEIRPDLENRAALEWPAAMLYFGMINWTLTWMRASGPAKPARIAELAASIYLDGIGRAKFPN
jgi:AcrR family transcriptional regulator